MALKTTPFDAAAYLDSPEAISEFLSDALETEDIAYVSHAFGVIARAKGMTDLAKEIGVSRQSLYKSLSEGGRPDFGTILKVVKAFGVSLSARPVSTGELGIVETTGERVHDAEMAWGD